MDFDKWFDTGGKDKLLEIGGTAISMVPQYTLRAIGKMVWTTGLDCREFGTCNCDGKVANTGYCALHDRRYRQCKAVDPETRKRCYKVSHDDKVHQAGAGKGVVVWVDK